MLKIFFLCILTNHLAESATNYDVLVGRTISGSSFEPFNEVSMKDGRQCISICTYNKKCKAFDVQPVPNGIECRFFEFDQDFFVRNRGVLVNKNGVKLYSTKNLSAFKTCQELYKAGFRKNGVYKVHLFGRHNGRLVYCYMEGGGGGWMAFQRRFDGSVDFHTKQWNDYKNGFGNGDGEYWLGNDMLHEITSSSTHDLYVVAKNFTGDVQTKKFAGFSIGSESSKYLFNYQSIYSGYSSFTLFERCLNKNFTTSDQDNDDVSTNCAVSYPGGWWFSTCHSDFMNGQYSNTETCAYGKGLHWHSWQGYYKCLKETLLMIKEQTTV